MAENRGLLQTVTQVAGLLAGLATLVYVGGAVVLSLRLAFADLPWGNVVSPLPREFLLSVGAGQVLLPALLLGTFYGLYRLLRQERPHAPVPPRWRDGPATRWAVVRGYLLGSLLMLVPLAVVMGSRWIDRGEPPRLAPILVALLALPFSAIAVQEARAILIREARIMRPWNSLKAAVAMGGVYVAAAIPAFVVAAGAVPFSEVRVCDEEGPKVSGYLVGETSDRFYVGERGEKPLRIVVVPVAKVDGVFIGQGARERDCL